MQDTAPAPNDLNPRVLVNLGVATIDGTIPAANLPVGTDSDQVAAGDDNRFPIPLSAAPSRGLEVWIAPDRTDNPTAAKGTYEDPLDGSTRAKFEAALNSLHTNLTIHLLPGTFHTLGAQGAGPMKEGWRVIGAGMDKTTILLDPVPNASNLEQAILGATEQLNAFTLTDLTLDGNIANQPNGLLVHGGGISCVVGTYERVHLLNWGQTPLTINDEAFGISPGADPGLPKIVPPYFRIIDCVVDAPAGNAASMINLGYAGGTVPTDFASGEIRGNIVTGSYTSAGIALAGCFNGVIISGNHVRHCGRGFHQDTLIPNPPAGAVLSIYEKETR